MSGIDDFPGVEFESEKPMGNDTQKGITRRSAIRTAGLAFTASSGPAQPTSSKRPVTAFALAGDRYHNIDYIRTALGKTLVRDLGISIDFTDELKALTAANLKPYKLLILFRDGMVWPGGYEGTGGRGPIVSDPPLSTFDQTPVYWMTTEQGKAVKEFVQNGGAALFYHNVTYISPQNEEFRDVLGAVTRQHPPLRPFKVKIVNHEHPITRGVKDFVVTDEQHFVKYEKDPKYVLMQSVNEDGLAWKDEGTSSVAGWAYDYGKGRICYLAPGHVITALWNPEYEKIQKNAVNWLLRVI
jgi:type 1 glutamine amidotransferase